jgi:hypothetical protein
MFDGFIYYSFPVIKGQVWSEIMGLNLLYANLLYDMANKQVIHLAYHADFTLLNGNCHLISVMTDIYCAELSIKYLTS